MAHQSLYRRYRSQKFSELRGQSHVTSALRTAVAEGRHGHAYLFSGPRGTGKTSTARILAKALNCLNVTDGEPCGECDSCIAIEHGKSFDLHELDAASHNKVDDIRDLISKVHLGSPGRTKVYILDEVHMLSPGAENALLKTLEEPPEHVVFVLATTEPHKVVPTIRSRTQHFEFHLLPADELAEHVRWVISDANLDVEDDAIDYVLQQGGGSARDTLSALDLVAAGGVPAGTDVGVTITRAIGNRDPQAAIAAVQDGLTAGHEPRIIGEITVEVLRNAFLAAMGIPLPQLNDRTQATSAELAAELGPPTLTRSLEAIGQTLVEMRQAPDPRVPLEVTLLRLCRSAGGTDTADLIDRITALEGAVAALNAQLESGLAPQPARAGAPPAADTAATVTPPPTAASPSPPSSGAPDTAPPTDPPQKAGPASEARTKLEETTTKAPPSPRTRRQGSPRTTRPAPDEPSVPRPQPEPTPEPAPAAETQPTETKPALRSELTEAAVRDAFNTRLEHLSQKVRVRFKGGQVDSVEGSTVNFAVPNAIHRDRCADVGHEVEAALSDHFGQAVTLQIVVDSNASAPAPDPARAAPAATKTPTGDADEDIGPVEDLADATEQSANGIDRLTEAFPGSTVVEAATDQHH